MLEHLSLFEFVAMNWAAVPLFFIVPVISLLLLRDYGKTLLCSTFCGVVMLTWLSFRSEQQAGGEIDIIFWIGFAGWAVILVIWYLLFLGCIWMLGRLSCLL